jgi:hypothetical protein
MKKLARADLYPLEVYATERPSFRARVLAHKKDRQVPLGPNATLYFENRLTIQYQIQEMLRIERIFEPEAIEEELETYNPLIPDGRNWKATFMLEFPDVEERRTALAQLNGVEERVWVCVGDHERVFALADEDLERSTDEKTSAVHFLRFDLNDDMATSLAAGAPIAAGIDMAGYRQDTGPVPDRVRASLVADLD